MSTFKVGDKVRCIQNRGFIEKYWIEEDVICTITKMSSSHELCLAGWGNTRFTPSRFILAEPASLQSSVCRKIQSMEKRFKERHV